MVFVNKIKKEGRKKMFYLTHIFNMLHSVGHMIKDHSYIERKPAAD